MLTVSRAVSSSDDFSVVGSSCGAPLKKGESCTVSLWFAPQGLGARSGTLQIESDATPTARLPRWYAIWKHWRLNRFALAT